MNILRLSGFGYKLQAAPDLAQRSPQDSRFFVGSIWVMETYDLPRVRIQIDGARGKSELGVPIPAFAESTLRMQKSLGALLLGCMIFLANGIVSVVGASVREAQLQPGQAPTSKGLRRARISPCLGLRPFC